ncbi:MAG: hypothetical protein C4558_07470 [Dehalococcoidia bacterium]|nr:MAG: hypothetical protein C4558_07470 [Dehalococcoidia bacterium]
MSIDQPDEQRSLVEKVRQDFHFAEQFQKPFLDKCEHYYSLYRNVSDFRTTLTQARGDDAAAVRRDGQNTFGADLFIPYAFWTVETVLPRLLSNDPTVNILPRGAKTSAENVENMKFLIDAQNERMKLGLRLHPIAKNGLLYGLGVGKVFWNLDKRTGQRLTQTELGGWVPEEGEEIRYDDPMVEAVAPWDFLWDPYASSLDDCEFVIQRSWRSFAYVKRMVEQEVWDLVTPDQLSDLESLGPVSRYEEVRFDHTLPDGMKPSESRGLHEVWEWHNGGKVCTVLDGTVAVKSRPNYWHGELPFATYRPTVLSHEFVGIGEIEPIEDLQHEMNTLRAQRRDNATLVLQKVIAYAEGIIDPDDIRIQPGGLIPLPGDPRELLMPIEFGTIPNSGYQEADEIRSDIERTSGLSDSVVGKESRGDTTATEVQLVQSAANVRIQQKTKLLEVETITRIGNHEIALNQQKVVTEKDVRVVEPPKPGTLGPRWSWRTLGPGELAGQMECVAPGGATAPDNVPQMRNDVTLWQSQMENPHLDQRQVTRKIIENLGEDPDVYMGPNIVPLPFLEHLAGSGVPPQLLQEAMQVAEAQPAAGDAPPALPPPEQPPAEPDPAQLAIAQSMQENTQAMRELIGVMAGQGPPQLNVAPAPVNVAPPVVNVNTASDEERAAEAEAEQARHAELLAAVGSVGEQMANVQPPVVNVPEIPPPTVQLPEEDRPRGFNVYDKKGNLIRRIEVDDNELEETQ